MTRGRKPERAQDEDYLRLCRMGLTPRECEVLGWIAYGKRDADIGKILGIAPKTVGKHIEHLLGKLHAENRTAAVSVAREMLRQEQPRRSSSTTRRLRTPPARGEG